MQYDSTRKAVLSRADGVVFVANSQTSQSINNGESFQNLAENCGRVGLHFETLPLVVMKAQASAAAIQRAVFVAGGATTMIRDARDKVALGLTSVDEVLRVLGPQVMD